MSTSAIITRIELALRWQRERLQLVKLRRPLKRTIELYRLQDSVVCIIVMIWRPEVGLENRHSNELKSEVWTCRLFGSAYQCIIHASKFSEAPISSTETPVKLIRIQNPSVSRTRSNFGEPQPGQRSDEHRWHTPRRTGNASTVPPCGA